MQHNTLVNFLCPTSKKAEYLAACSFLGTDMSVVCRGALESTIAFAKKMGMPEGYLPPTRTLKTLRTPKDVLSRKQKECKNIKPAGPDDVLLHPHATSSEGKPAKPVSP